jgi:hypothetical protein
MIELTVIHGRNDPPPMSAAPITSATALMFVPLAAFAPCPQWGQDLAVLATEPPHTGHRKSCGVSITPTLLGARWHRS